MNARFSLAALLIGSFSACLAGDWMSLSALQPGQRLEIYRPDKLDRGNFAYVRAEEIVITTNNGDVVIPRAQVEGILARGEEKAEFAFVRNMNDQLFPGRYVVYLKEPSSSQAVIDNQRPRDWWQIRKHRPAK